MKISESTMRLAGHSFCMPVTLLINFALFQYLMTMYYKRRKEIRGALLLFCAFWGFVALIPFSYPDDTMVGHLNDISETCSTLTFLIQITIIGRDINKKVKISTLKYLTYVAELLILLGLLVVLQNLFQVSFPHVDVGATEQIDNVMEDVGLLFIFCFRFLILAMSRGMPYVFQNKKLEMAMYLLFITHEYPFVVLEDQTGVSWELVQALWNRLTIAMCIGLTIKDKIRTTSGNASRKMHTNNPSRGPPEMTVAMTGRSFRIAKATAVISAGRRSVQAMVLPINTENTDTTQPHSNRS